MLDLSSPIIGEREITVVLYGPVTTTMLDPVTVLGAERYRTKGIWQEPLRQPAPPRRCAHPARNLARLP